MATRVVAAAAVLLLVACGGSDSTAAEAPATAAPQGLEELESESPEEGSWSYAGETGPANWAELDADYATCAAGQRQSPVDLPLPAEAAPVEAVSVTYGYQPAAYELNDTDRTIQADAESPAGGITVDGEDYELLQFHAHAPSEHAFAGERTDLEVHLVHQNAAGELAVVGVLLEEGQSSSALVEAWADLPSGEETASLADFDAGALLPEDRTAYQYRGSLTTPPCTEGVQWLLMQEVVTAPAEVISGFEDAVGKSARPLQPLGEREPGWGYQTG